MRNAHSALLGSGDSAAQGSSSFTADVGARVALGVAACCLLLGSTPAAFALDPPDKASSFEGEPIAHLAASKDGRVVAAMGSSSGTVRIFDARSTTSMASTNVSVAVSGLCSDPRGVFVSSNYIVSVPCGSDGTVRQFQVSENSSVSSAAPLSASSAVSVTSGLAAISAAAYDSSSDTLYLAGNVTGQTLPIVYSLAGSKVSQTPAPFAQPTLTTTISKMIVQSTGRLLIADSAAGIYSVTATGVQNTLVTCSGATPKALLQVSTSLALLLGGSDDVYAIVMSSSLPSSCTAYDWDLKTPSALALVSTSATSYVYVRGLTSSGADVAVYTVADVESKYTGPTPSSTYSIKSGTTVGVSDPLIGSPLYVAYLGSADGLSLLSSGPVLKVSGLTEPAQLTEDDDGLALTLTTDETVSTVWWDTAPPVVSSRPSTNISGKPVVGASTTVTLDLTTDDLESGLNTVYIYAVDANSNLGWTAVRVRSVSTPEALANFSIKFGDGKLYLYFDAPSDETVDGYEVLIATESFENPGSADLPAGWTSGDPTFVVASTETTYPVGGTWPMSLEALTDTTVWSEVEGQIVYALSPLENDTEYYVAIRATVGDVTGLWTGPKSGIPETTCGAACLADEAGGFCSYSSAAGGRTFSSRWSLLPLLGLAFFFIRRRGQA